MCYPPIEAHSSPFVTTPARCLIIGGMPVSGGTSGISLLLVKCMMKKVPPTTTPARTTKVNKYFDFNLKLK